MAGIAGALLVGRAHRLFAPASLSAVGARSIDLEDSPPHSIGNHLHASEEE